MADIAFASGFGSIRQFNDTIVEVYDRTPSQVRAARHPNAVEAGSAVTPAARISLALPVREPFGAAGVFAWLAARAVPGVEDAGTAHYARTISLPHGPAVFEVRYDRQLRLTAELSALADLPPLVSRVRRLFDADADPVGIDAALSLQPALADSVRRTPGIRLPGAVAPHETLLRMMIGQQISVAAARTQLRRLVEACGSDFPPPLADGSESDAGRRLSPTKPESERRPSPTKPDPERRPSPTKPDPERRPSPTKPESERRPSPTEPDPERWLSLTKPEPDATLVRLFPTAAQVAAHGREALVGPKARIESILGVAERLASGELDLDWADDPKEQYQRLVAERGIGEWTANYVAMRVLGHPDVLPTGDVALRTGAARLGLPDRPAELAAWGARVSPWRSYAALHLWAASARKDNS